MPGEFARNQTARAVLEFQSMRGIFHSMKLGREIAIFFAGGFLLLSGSLRAAETLSSDNPYAPVVTRNVFDLNPPTPPVTTSAEPPPKITLNGIMSEFGHLQALFKVTIPPKPGRSSVEKSYILAETKQQDDIEVVHIDEKTDIVTFNNHGIMQEIPLAIAPAIAFSPSAPPAAIQNPNFSANRISSGGGNAVFTIGNGNRAVTRNRSLNNSSYGSNLGGGPTGSALQQQSADPSQQSQQTMSAAAQMAIIEQNRIEHQKEIDNGTYPPLPPTALTPPGATGANGQPLMPPMPP
jgi:hypothetical protein